MEAIWQRVTLHKLVIVQISLGLFAGRSPAATRKKSSYKPRIALAEAF